MAGIALDADSLIISAVNSPQVGETTESSFNAPVEPDVFIDVAETEGVSFSRDSLSNTFIYPLDGSEGPSGIRVDSEAPAGLLAECRICLEEDSVENLETPCACCGSVEHAHRVCVQRWCYRKGGTTCEICQQPYKDGYEATAEMTERPLDGEGHGLSGAHVYHDCCYVSVICTCILFIILNVVFLLRRIVDPTLVWLILSIGAVSLFLPYIVAKGVAGAVNILRLRRQRQEAAMGVNEVIETDPLVAIRQ